MTRDKFMMLVDRYVDLCVAEQFSGDVYTKIQAEYDRLTAEVGELRRAKEYVEKQFHLLEIALKERESIDRIEIDRLTAEIEQTEDKYGELCDATQAMIDQIITEGWSSDKWEALVYRAQAAIRAAEESK